MKESLQHPVAVMGLPINGLSADDAVDTLERMIQSGGTHQVCTMNVDIWLNALADSHLHRIVAGSSLVFPDGTPLMWASGLLGCPLAERVTGADLVPRLAELSARKGYKIFLLGGKPGVAHRACRLLQRNYPGVQIVGTFAPAEENLIRMDHAEILRKIHAAGPDILLVAFGNPNQEKWIWMHRKRLGVPLSMGVGDSFDVLVGDTRRAPRWMQKCGLEWAVRFLQEPVRLGPRYLRDFAGLARYLPMALMAAWWQRPYLDKSTLIRVATPQVMHVSIHGRLGAEIAAQLQDATTASIINGSVMVVHLNEVQQMTAAGLGVLLGARRQLLEAGLSLSLAGLNLKKRFVLHAWNLNMLFDEWHPAISKGRRLVAEAGSLVHAGLPSEREVFSADMQIRG
jgi:N-acetylglucosaminyldiphosphoundecaprenol N-acetyl-beta-D-mannosaminyltransferase